MSAAAVTGGQVIPHCVKLAIVVGMGLLIALIGMVSINLVVPDERVRAYQALCLSMSGSLGLWPFEWKISLRSGRVQSRRSPIPCLPALGRGMRSASCQ
jgi:hypothetical protein